MRRALGPELTLAVLLSLPWAEGCAPIPMKYDDCKQQCAARGEDVAKYQAGIRFPIFKPNATVVCQCSAYGAHP